MRHVTNAGLALIKRFESFSPTVYVCPAGYPTIGYGHVVLRRKVNREEHGEVPAEFRRWVFAGGRKLKGLVRRREAEGRLYAAQLAQIFLTGHAYKTKN